VQRSDVFFVRHYITLFANTDQEMKRNSTAVLLLQLYSVSVSVYISRECNIFLVEYLNGLGGMIQNFNVDTCSWFMIVED